MLERIENISRNKSYKRKRHSSNFEKYFNRNGSSVKIAKDSIRFSSAALYLSSLKWNIREIEYPAPDNIVFDFFIGEFEFRTKIDIGDFFNIPLQNFLVSKLEYHNNRKNKIIANINVKKEIVKSLINNSEVEMEVFKELFKRLEELKVKHTLNTSDSVMLNNLLEGFEEKLFAEFSKIINNLYSFIYKHENFTVPNQFSFKKNNLELVTIEEIATYYS